MSYIKSMMLPGEEIVYQAWTSKIALLNAAVIFAVLMQFKGIVRLLRCELALTNRRVLGKTGYIVSKTIALPHAKITAVHCRQGLLGKFLDYGDVIIVNEAGDRIIFKGIALPMIFEQEVNEAIEVAVLGRKLSDYAPQF